MNDEFFSPSKSDEDVSPTLKPDEQIEDSSTLTPRKEYGSYTQLYVKMETQSERKKRNARDGVLDVSYIPEGSTKNISDINTEKQYRCEWCRLRYLSQEELNTHIKTEHAYSNYSIE